MPLIDNLVQPDPVDIEVRVAALEASVASFGGKVVPTAHGLITRAEQIAQWLTHGTIPPRPKKKATEDETDEGPSFVPSVQAPIQSGTFADLRASLLRPGEQVINQREIDDLIDAARADARQDDIRNEPTLAGHASHRALDELQRQIDALAAEADRLAAEDDGAPDDNVRRVREKKVNQDGYLD